MSGLFSNAPISSTSLDSLAEAVEELLGESGCAWNKQQTHHSLATYLREETYELLDAIEDGNPDDVKEELGDVLFQIFLHAEIARLNGDGFDIYDVAADVDTKMRTRHPHVFGDEPTDSIEVIETVWNAIKAEEKSSRTSVLEGISQDLPALALADKVIGRGQSIGVFGDAGLGGIPIGDEKKLGQVLLGLVASARSAGIDAEAALRATVRDLQAEIQVFEEAMSDAGVVGQDPSTRDSA